MFGAPGAAEKVGGLPREVVVPALDRFDTQLAGLASALTGTASGRDERNRMATLAETSQARMLRKPQDAMTAQGRPFPAGVLDLLRSDAIQIVWGADGGALARA